jgi:hypothetical protein
MFWYPDPVCSKTTSDMRRHCTCHAGLEQNICLLCFDPCTSMSGGNVWVFYECKFLTIKKKIKKKIKKCFEKTKLQTG